MSQKMTMKQVIGQPHEDSRLVLFQQSAHDTEFVPVTYGETLCKRNIYDSHKQAEKLSQHQRANKSNVVKALAYRRIYAGVIAISKQDTISTMHMARSIGKPFKAF
jgi:hypothetical protein